MGNANIILWALPAGETDRLHEQPMTSFPHGFRRTIEDNELPDFTGAVNGVKRKR
jgi:hypothetical protein